MQVQHNLVDSSCPPGQNSCPLYFPHTSHPEPKHRSLLAGSPNQLLQCRLLLWRELCQQWPHAGRAACLQVAQRARHHDTRLQGGTRLNSNLAKNLHTTAKHSTHALRSVPGQHVHLQHSTLRHNATIARFSTLMHLPRQCHCESSRRHAHTRR